MFGLSASALKWICVALTAAVLLAGVYVKGRHDVQVKFNAYKAEVRARADAQKKETERIEVKNAKVTKQVAEKFRKQIDVLRSHYADRRVSKSGSGTVPEVAGTTQRTDGDAANYVSADAAYDRLSEQCAETTLMLVGLQEWVTQVSDNTND